MIDCFINFFSSLRLTVVCLALALIVVFVGTMAQVHLGLYAVQQQYFHSFFIYWVPAGTNWKIPVLPGGWLVGWLLLVNLFAAHIKRFQFSRKKIGILLVHAGLIFLLIGQFCTEIVSVESTMRLEIGETKNYAEDNRKNELVVIDTTNPDRDDVFAIPQSTLEKGGDIHVARLPFTISVKKFLANSLPAGPMSGDGEKIKAGNGIGQRLFFTAAPAVTRMDDENKPAALVGITSDKGPIGTWTVSTWMTRHPWSSVLQEQVGGLLNTDVELPQGFSCNGHTYQLALRAVRYYQPYSITLLEFKHDVYAGTDIPKNFSSKIHLKDPSRGEDRDVLIYMNSPLRYRGEAYYQASFEPGDRVSILQVVRNPASSTPYLACGLIGIGLVIQFLTHLFGFSRKQAKAKIVPAARLEPALNPGIASVVGGQI